MAAYITSAFKKLHRKLFVDMQPLSSRPMMDSLESRQLMAVTLPTIPARSFSITSYGASTSSSNNATAIQAAINAAVTAGGGTVSVPTGTFLSGPITLGNSINLQVNGTLKMLAYGTYPGSTNFIGGTNLHDIEVSGSGTIDGQGSAWWTAFNSNSALVRPGMIYISACTRVEVANVHLLNAPNVHLSFHYACSNVTLSYMNVSAPSTAPNTDGVDLEGANYFIDHCTIACGDDNIAVQPGHVAATNLTIQNCTFGVGHGLSIGSYVQYGVNGMTVTNCTFNGTTSGIRMKSARGRGGLVQNVSYTGLTMTNVRYPIYITSYYPSLPTDPSTDAGQAVTSTTPSWKNITISNLTSTNTATNSVAGIFWGLPEATVWGVTLSNVKIKAYLGFTLYHAHNITWSNGSAVQVTSGSQLLKYDYTGSGTPGTTV